MELFTVWTDVSGQEEADQFYRCIKRKTKGLHISKRGFRLTFKHNDGKAASGVQRNENHNDFQQWLPQISELFANGLDSPILLWLHENDNMVEDMISKACSVMDEHEVEKVKSNLHASSIKW